MKRGISIVSLGIVLVIMGLISATIVVNYSHSTNHLNKVKFLTEFMNLESALENYYSMNDSYPLLEAISLKYEDEETITQFDGETILDKTINLYKLDVATLGFDNLILGNGKSDTDYYAVSTVTGKLYYLKGFEYDNNIYYRVTEELTNDYE